MGGHVHVVDKPLLYYRVDVGISTLKHVTSYKAMQCESLSRTQHDAQQRLADVLYMAPFQKKWIRMAHKAIARQQQCIRLSQTRDAFLELRLLGFLCTCNVSFVLFKLYLRVRFPQLIQRMKRLREHIRR